MSNARGRAKPKGLRSPTARQDRPFPDLNLESESFCTGFWVECYAFVANMRFVVLLGLLFSSPLQGKKKTEGGEPIGGGRFSVLIELADFGQAEPAVRRKPLIRWQASGGRGVKKARKVERQIAPSAQVDGVLPAIF